jgi:hypothetical protein
MTKRQAKMRAIDEKAWSDLVSGDYSEMPNKQEPKKSEATELHFVKCCYSCKHYYIKDKCTRPGIRTNRDVHPATVCRHHKWRDGYSRDPITPWLLT